MRMRTQRAQPRRGPGVAAQTTRSSTSANVGPRSRTSTLTSSRRRPTRWPRPRPTTPGQPLDLSPRSASRPPVPGGPAVARPVDDRPGDLRARLLRAVPGLGPYFLIYAILGRGHDEHVGPDALRERLGDRSGPELRDPRAHDPGADTVPLRCPWPRALERGLRPLWGPDRLRGHRGRGGRPPDDRQPARHSPSSSSSS